jgi:hypothetical protein
MQHWAVSQPLFQGISHQTRKMELWITQTVINEPIFFSSIFL